MLRNMFVLVVVLKHGCLMRDRMSWKDDYRDYLILVEKIKKGYNEKMSRM